jgi:DNA-binding transcriptional LysR family regulator
MRELDLRHLRVVCLVADTGSLSRAAARLGVSQPALTAQLQRIERRVGAALFLRGNGGVRPTELGSYVVASARVVLGDVDRLTRGIAELVRAHPDDALRLAGFPGARVPVWTARMVEALDGTDVQMDTLADAAALTERVLDGSADFAQLEIFPGFSGPLPGKLQSRLLVHEPLFVALPQEHPLAAAEEVRLADLAGEEWVMLPLHASAEQLVFSRACADAGFSPRVRHQVTDASTARTLVARGAASLATPTSRDGGGLAVRPLAGSPLVQHVVMAWRWDGPRAVLADRAFRCAALGYLELLDLNPYYRRWWDAHPQAHTELDDVLGA